MDTQLHILLNLLSGGGYKTSQELADDLNLSEKTVRTRIKEFNFTTSGNGATITSKRGSGYKLVITNKQKYKDFLSEKSQEGIHFKTSDDRVMSLFLILITSKDYIKLDDLSDSWFISKSTLSNDLKKVEQNLNRYDIELIRKPHYGIKAKGNEFNLRACLTSNILRRDMFFFNNEDRNIKMQIVSKATLSVIRNRGFALAEIFLQDFLMHIYIAWQRIADGLSLPADFKTDDTLVEQKENDAANEIADNLEKTTDTIFSKQERDYIALHLAGKRTLKSNSLAEQNIIISTKIVALVSNMLNAVYNTFNIDFRNNLELRLSLSQHLVPLNIRLRYDFAATNPLLREIKEKYLFAYTIASTACVPLREYYKKDISEDEIGYFALLFALELERSHRKIYKKKILIICPSGKGTSQLLIYRFKEEFKDYISDITACDEVALENIDFTKYDYVFTTVPINIPIPVPIMEVNEFLNYGEIENVKNVLSVIDKDIMKKYYFEELFFTNLTGKTKEEVLKNICDLLSKKRELPDDFLNAVLKRESLISTDLGNLVALPHPYNVITKDTFVTVAILNEPILWANNMVQIVFLVSISDDVNEDLQEFYKSTTNLLLNKKQIKEIINRKSFDYLLDSF